MPHEAVIAPITKSDIDKFISYASSRDDATSSVAGYYLDQLAQQYDDESSQALSKPASTATRIAEGSTER